MLETAAWSLGRAAIEVLVGELTVMDRDRVGHRVYVGESRSSVWM